MQARFAVCHANWALVAPLARRASYANTMDAPTTNRKVGNTRSVAVNPFHSAWCIWAQAERPPLLFTMIMNAIVTPRRMSSDSSRFMRAGAGAGLVMTTGISCEPDALIAPTLRCQGHTRQVPGGRERRIGFRATAGKRKQAYRQQARTARIRACSFARLTVPRADLVRPSGASADMSPC